MNSIAASTSIYSLRIKAVGVGDEQHGSEQVEVGGSPFPRFIAGGVVLVHEHDIDVRESICSSSPD